MKPTLLGLIVPLALAQGAGLPEECGPAIRPLVMEAARLAALAEAARATPACHDDSAAASKAADSRLVVANADGVLDAARAAGSVRSDSISNPFMDRIAETQPIREVPVAIGAVLIGESGSAQSAVINGKIYTPGDAFEGFALASISADMIELRRDDIRLQVPVRDAPVMLRLPP